jgi:hypothetical protein
MIDHGAHHLLHVVLLGGATVAFALAVVRDIRRHGFAGFSWRITPEDDRS